MAGNKIVSKVILVMVLASLGLILLGGTAIASSVDPSDLAGQTEDVFFTEVVSEDENGEPIIMDVLYHDIDSYHTGVSFYINRHALISGWCNDDGMLSPGDAYFIRTTRSQGHMNRTVGRDTVDDVVAYNCVFDVDVDESSTGMLELTSEDTTPADEDQITVSWDFGTYEGRVLEGSINASSDVGVDSCNILLVKVEEMPTFDVTVLGMENMDDPSPDVLLELETVTSTDVTLELDKAPAQGDRVVVLIRNWWKNEITVSESETYAVPKNYFADSYVGDDQEPVEFTVYDTNNIGSATMGAIISSADAGDLDGEFRISFVDPVEEVPMGVMAFSWPEESDTADSSGGGCSLSMISPAACVLLLPLVLLEWK